MRSLLLATAALAVLGAHSAMAADVAITSTVTAACNMVAANTATAVTLDPGGAVTGAQNYTFECNYAAGNANVTFSSLYGGVSSDLGVTDHVYNIDTSFTDGTSAAPPAFVVPNGAAPFDDVTNTFTLQLQAPILVAGVYVDTLSINVAP